VSLSLSSQQLESNLSQYQRQIPGIGHNSLDHLSCLVQQKDDNIQQLE
jgi:hypothetical protein